MDEYTREAEKATVEIEEMFRNTPAMKIDHTLLPVDALAEISRVLMHGEEKHGPWNWANNPLSYRQLLAKALRHIFSFQRGEELDEHGLSNLACAICDLMFLCSNTLQNRGVDDRFKY